jgi:transposase
LQSQFIELITDARATPRRIHSPHPSDQFDQFWIKGFHVQRKRWIVERTLGWLGRWRRLSKNYERKTDTAEAIVYISMTYLMLRRLTK